MLRLFECHIIQAIDGVIHVIRLPVRMAGWTIAANNAPQVPDIRETRDTHMTIKVALNGAAGAMGRRVVLMAAGDEQVELVAAVECPEHPALGQDAGVIAGSGSSGVALTSELNATADVLIDFSSPDATVRMAETCAQRGIAVVACTTGLTDQQEAILRAEVASRVPLIHPSNTSLGVNLLFRLAEQAAAALADDYDIEIVEAHHRRKKDAPSGTAKELAQRVCRAKGLVPEQTLLYGRKGICGARAKDEIAVLAIRGGDIVGEHTILFAAEGERIELTHRASSRDVFARGAIRAAKFVAGKPPGVYTMSDVLS